MSRTPLGDRWAIHYEECRGCGDNWYRHQAHGLCVRCYNSAIAPIKPNGYIANDPEGWKASIERKEYLRGIIEGRI